MVRLLAAGLLSLATLGTARAQDALTPCETLVAQRPEAREGYRCFYLAARGGAPWEAVEARLAELEAHPVHGSWALLARSNMHSDQGEADTPAMFRESMARFEAADLPMGGIYARLGLATWHSYDDEFDQSLALLDEAEALVPAAEEMDPWAGAMVRSSRARFLRRMGQPEAAIAMLEEMAPDLFPEAPYQLKLVALYTLTNALAETGRYTPAYGYGEQLVDLAVEAGDHHVAATALLGQAILLGNHAPLLQQVGPERAVEVATRAVEEARQGRNPWSEGGALLQLGLLLGREGEAQVRESNALMAEMGQQARFADQLSYQALFGFEEDPHGAIRSMEEALELGLAYAGDETPATQVTRLHLGWALLEVGQSERALAELGVLLDVIETWRDRQWDPEARAWVGDVWGVPYYLLAGERFERGEVEEAVATMERLRAQGLRDALVRARVEVPPEVARARQDYRGALGAVSEAQLALMDPEQEPGGRAEAQAALGEAEAAVVLSREALARTQATVPGWSDLAPASLGEVQAALRADEALVLYQLSHHEPVVSWLYPDSGTPAWAAVVTADAMVGLPLGDSEGIRRAVEAYGDLVSGRTGGEHVVTPGLHGALLAPVLQHLPAGTRRLVVVPDAGLHRVPFADLHPDPEGPPLVAELAVSVAPSATVWLTLRRSEAPAGAAVLALADPVSPLAGTGDARAGSAWEERLAGRLEPLVHARDEGRAASRAGGEGSGLRVGAEASEAALAALDLRGVSVLHLAAHALVDVEDPQRSTVVLAAGGGHDGLLQAREVAELDLAGRVVVLSACDSATGAALRGEGVMGLSRAFFQAGAKAVVAALWPVRDAEARVLFERFYDHLGRGLPVDEALARAQVEQWRAGAPAEAWAGFVVLGDGAAAPLPPATRLLPAALVAGLTGLLALVGLRLRANRRRA